jgi:plasmid maintenance system antidote protein VapI
MTLTETLRKAVRDSKLTLYRIGLDSGVKRQSLERFMANRQSLRLDMADKLAAFFRLELRPAKGRRKAKG